MFRLYPTVLCNIFAERNAAPRDSTKYFPSARYRGRNLCFRSDVITKRLVIPPLIKINFSRRFCTHSIFTRHPGGLMKCLFTVDFPSDFHGLETGENWWQRRQELQLHRNNVGMQINPKSPASTASCRSLHAKCHTHVRIHIRPLNSRPDALQSRNTRNFRFVPASSKIHRFQYHPSN